MRHRKFESLIDAYICNELPEQEQTPFEEHMLACKSCREKLLLSQAIADGIKVYGEELFAVTSPAPEPSLDQRIQEMIRGFTPAVQPIPEIPLEQNYAMINPLAERQPKISSLRLNRWMWGTMLFILFTTMSAFGLFFRQLVIQQKKQESIRISQQMQKDKQERISELRNEIYERLREREEIKKEGRIPPGKPDVQRDPWTSTPLTIAILDIPFFSDPSHARSASFTEEVYRTLSHLFVEDPRVQVAERNELDRLLDEKSLLLSDLPLQSSEDRQLFGRFLYAKVMLFLDVYQAKAGISLSYILVDGEIGKILKLKPKMLLTKKDLPASLAETIYNDTKDILYKRYPLRGRITSIQNEMITIDIGSEVGVAEGDTFEVFDPALKNGLVRKMGQIRVMPNGVEPGRAQCKIIIGNGFKEKLKVELTG